MANKYLKIDTQTEASLYRFIESSKKAREKRRAMAILMSGEKKSVVEISKKLEMNTDTIYDWLILFTAEGIEGIKDKPILGRPKKLQIEDEKSIKEVLKKSP